MKKHLKTVLCVLAAVMITASAAFAAIAGEKVQTFKVSAEETSGRDEYDGAVMQLLSGHEIKLTVSDVQPENVQADFSYKSSRKSVASVDNEGLIHGKKAGSALITVKAQPGKAKQSLRVKVKANQSKTRAFPKGSAPSPSETGSIIPVAKRVYEKNGDLLIDMYIYNANTRPVKKTCMMKIFFQEVAGTDMMQYMDLGDYKVTVKRTAPGKYTVAKINLGSLDELCLYADTVVLLDSMAFGQEVEPVTAKNTVIASDRIVTEQIIRAMLAE